MAVGALGAVAGISALLAAQNFASDDGFFGLTGPVLVRKLSFKTPPAIVITDPISSGLMLASMLQAKGYAVIRVISSENFSAELLALTPKNIKPINWAATIYHDGSLPTTIYRYGIFTLKWNRARASFILSLLISSSSFLSQSILEMTFSFLLPSCFLQSILYSLLLSSFTLLSSLPSFSLTIFSFFLLFSRCFSFFSFSTD
jgi:hypothetical protein